MEKQINAVFVWLSVAQSANRKISYNMLMSQPNYTNKKQKAGLNSGNTTQGTTVTELENKGLPQIQACF